MTGIRRVATSSHVEDRPDRRPATPYHPLAAKRTTVTSQGRDPDQGGDLLAIQMAELRDVGEQGAAHHRPYARHTAEEILFGAPDGTARDRVIEVAIGGR
jgi:hypothetical protein